MPARSHELYWLSSNLHSVTQLIQEGFNWIDCAAGWGEPNANWDGRDCTSFKNYCDLLPVSAEQWLPQVSSEFFPTPMSQDGWGHPAPKSFFTQTSQFALNRTELSDWYRDTFLKFDPDVHRELQTALFEPHLLVRLGYHLARKAALQLGVTSLPFQAAMTAVGSGCRGIDLWICNHCFRRSRGELRICDLHSQAKVVLDISKTERSLQFQKARTARKAAIKIDAKDLPKRQFNGYWDLELYEFELQVGGILWPLTGTSHRDWLEHVHRALLSAPLVKSRLPQSFESAPNHEQIEQLQRAVGSREWLVSRWPTLIPVAETWLQAEKKVAPGAITPGLTEENRKRVAVAQELLANNVRHSQIADQLGISRSHLSHLLRRGEVNKPK